MLRADALLTWLATQNLGLKKAGNGWLVRCPGPDHSRQDRDPSLSVGIGDDGATLLNCFARKCEPKTIIAAWVTRGLPTPNGRARRSSVRKAPAEGLTLQALADAKRLPLDLLQALGLRDATFGRTPVVSIPYRDERGAPLAARYRIGMNGDRFRWEKGAKVALYGIDRLAEIRRAGWVIFVEGESDVWTARHHGIVPVVGIPGKATWKPEWAALFTGLTVYFWQEPGASDLTAKLAADFPDLRVFVPPEGFKDLSAAHLAGQDVPALIAHIRATARPYADLRDEETRATLAALRAEAAPALAAQDPLGLVVTAARSQGYGGDATALQLAYLSATSRVLKLRNGAIPFHLMLVGPPSSGKSYAVKLALGFLPPQAVRQIDASSPRALLYSADSLKHRVLFYAERDSLPDDRGEGGEDNPAASAIRHLLQEGYMRYETVERDGAGKLVTVTHTKEGPTAMLTTGIRRVAAQLDSRLFAFDVPHDPDQINAALRAQAMLEELGAPMAPHPALIAFQSLLQALAPLDVHVGFAVALAKELERHGCGQTLAPRATRDYARLVALIKVVAVLNRERRERDDQGRIIATLDDYKVVHDLIGKLYEGAVTGATAKVREVVEAVRELVATAPDGVSQAAIRAHLVKAKPTPQQGPQHLHGVDKGTISGLVRTALKHEWLRNFEDRRGYPHRLVIGDELPPTGGLPTLDELRGVLGVGKLSPPFGAALESKDAVSPARRLVEVL